MTQLHIRETAKLVTTELHKAVVHTWFGDVHVTGEKKTVVTVVKTQGFRPFVGWLQLKRMFLFGKKMKFGGESHGLFLVGCF